MSKAGAFDLASGLGGKIDKNEVLSAVDKYVPLSRISHFSLSRILSQMHGDLIFLSLCISLWIKLSLYQSLS